jgi:asparagine synthase (glutamine-hydrolysing)
MTPVKSATNLLWIDGIGSLAAADESRVLLVGQHGNAAFSARGDNPVGETARLKGFAAAVKQARNEARGQEVGLGRILARAARDEWQGRFGKPLGSSVPTWARKYAAAPYRSALRDRANEYALVPGRRQFWAAFATTPRHVFWAEPVLQWGIEWRDPTADRRLLERLLQYPQAAFRTEGLRRGLARSLAKGLLPDSVRLRRTQGAQVPEAPSLIARHAAQYRQAIDAMRRSPACTELLDLKAVDHGLEAIVGGSRDYGEALALDRAFNVGLFLLHLEKRA